MMTPKQQISELRKELDKITAALVEHFNERQRLSSKIAQVKAKGNIAITDTNRECEVIQNAVDHADSDNKPSTATFVRTLIALSKIKQNEELGLLKTLEFPSSGNPKTGPIAFQGVPSAWSEQAANLIFPDRELKPYEFFQDVFDAIINGEAAYGVVPLDNSRTGAIGAVYDLLRKDAAFIVGEIWLDIAQCLIGIPGTKLSDIREVFSHEQGLAQCSRFLKNRNLELTTVSNTAVAAKFVSEKQNPKFAAIASRRSAEIYGLDVLAPDIADDKGNKTRFIVIAKEPEYTEKSNTVTVTFSTHHYSGALVAVLQAFMVAGINLKRIESRPAATPSNYRFFVDMEDANIMDPRIREAINEAAMLCEYFEILGCYSSYER